MRKYSFDIKAKNVIKKVSSNIKKNVRQHVIKLINIKPAARSCHAN